MTCTDVQDFSDLPGAKTAEYLSSMFSDDNIRKTRQINTGYAIGSGDLDASNLDTGLRIVLVSMPGNTVLTNVHKILSPAALCNVQTGKTRQTSRTENFAKHEEETDARAARGRLAFLNRLRNQLSTGLSYVKEGRRRMPKEAMAHTCPSAKRQAMLPAETIM